jgi:hypothetical protein
MGSVRRLFLRPLEGLHQSVWLNCRLVPRGSRDAEIKLTLGCRKHARVVETKGAERLPRESSRARPVPRAVAPPSGLPLRICRAADGWRVVFEEADVWASTAHRNWPLRLNRLRQASRSRIVANRNGCRIPARRWWPTTARRIFLRRTLSGPCAAGTCRAAVSPFIRRSSHHRLPWW